MNGMESSGVGGVVFKELRSIFERNGDLFKASEHFFKAYGYVGGALTGGMIVGGKLVGQNELMKKALEEVGGKMQMWKLTQAQGFAMGALTIATIDLADFVYEYMHEHPTLEAARKMLRYLETRKEDLEFTRDNLQIVHSHINKIPVL